jgi:threonine-phosphate decarboxylase
MKTSPHVLLPAHGGQLRQIATRYGLPVKLLTDFSANINPDGPPSSVLTAMRRAFESPATLAVYPDLELIDLKQTIARTIGCRPENITIANGFVPLLESALRSRKIGRCLLPVPCFSEYRRTLENSGVTVVPHRLLPDQGFEYEDDAILKAIVNHSCDAILLANPQNPSGALSSSQGMKRLTEMAARNRVTMLLDEAFIDYCPNESLTQWAPEQTNLIVFRSVTKFFAIPGLRVAYAVDSSCQIDAMNRFIAPWPVTSLASDAVCAALNDQTYGEESRLGNEQRRRWLARELARLKIATYPSSANFLLLRFSREVDVNQVWERMVVEEQIVLRSCANFEDLTERHLRIAVRSESENEKLICGLERILFRRTE